MPAPSSSLACVENRCIIAIGNFDGVHLGHQALLRSAREGLDLPLVVITFWPHPVAVLRPDQAPPLIIDLHTRIERLREAGAGEVRVIQFTHDVAELSPEQFLERFVVPLNPVRIVVGENFRFGKGASGHVEDLERLSKGRFRVHPLDLSTIDEAVTCSSLIRRSILDGDVRLAATHLGRPYSVHGVVVVGDQRGRELGFPTANLPVENHMVVPADGVYAGWLTDEDGTRHPAAISVGSNPTFDGLERRVESHVLGRTDLHLYGSEILVEFVAQLRGQVKFTGIEDLITQMDSDVAETARILGVPVPAPVTTTVDP